jgi:hypothetical protein
VCIGARMLTRPELRARMFTEATTNAPVLSTFARTMSRMSTAAGPDTATRRRAGSTWPEIVFAGDAQRSTLSQAVARGRLVRLAAGIYTGQVREEPATVARRAWWKILVHEFPAAVIADRSARTGAPEAGRLTVVHPRRRPLVLPGLTIVPRRGPGACEWDTVLPDGIVVSSQARGLLDNAAGIGERYLSAGELETWISDIVEHQGDAWLNELRDRARTLAKQTRHATAFAYLDRMIGAALATVTDAGVITPALRARAAGNPFDRRRVETFAAFAEALRGVAPDPLPALPAYAERRRLLPFYEAYFSNYIEGTEFTLDEAASIVFDEQVPTARPEDAHDILGTYQLVADDDGMRRTPRDAEDFVVLLKARHAVMLAERTSARPGRFKDRANRAGSTIFVPPELVEATLRAGFEAGSGLVDPFARAAYHMFLVSEVHPFTDGNGRIARIAMNSELVAADQVRIVIPTVYRNNYLAALKGATQNGHFAALIATLRFAQRYTARIDFSSRIVAERDLARTNALLDAGEAEDNGIRLTLP